MSSNGQSQRAFLRFITSPIRALGRARDLYVRSITKCGHNMNYSSPVAAFPRSYSINTSRSDDGEDFAELVRAASVRTLVDRIDRDLVLKQHHHATARQHQPVGSKGLPKSASVGMAKIDEEKPYEFAGGGDNGIPDTYPRSKSYAVRKRTVAF